MNTSALSQADRSPEIPLPSREFEQRAQARQDRLIKPRGALGRLEQIACWFAARQHRTIPEPLRPAITVFAADHGVAVRGVSAYPMSVTRQMLNGLVGGVAGISVLARAIDAPLTIVDVGVAGTEPPPRGVHNERIASGTSDLLVQPAMSSAQVRRALQIGARYANEAIASGATLLIAGEVGIGNTTTAACLICAVLAADPAIVVGDGTGITPQQRALKIDIVRGAVTRIEAIQDCDPYTLLSEVGGFEIAAMVGFYLEAARSGVPCLLDGFIATAAALVSCTIDTRVREWLLAAHVSNETGHALALEHLQLEPLLDCGLRLGEGSGAALAVPILQSALRLHAEMATFDEAGVSDRQDAC
jgi:nicotinate-nucleotide--dimethylbenzimidazole phosphoribosyltransferase